MQEAIPTPVQREPLLPAPLLSSLCRLNRRFLDLVAAGPGGAWGLPVPPALSRRIGHFPEDRLQAIALAPYALFDLRFAEEAHWAMLLAAGASNHVEDSPVIDASAAQFVQLGVFFAWHLAQTRPRSAPLVLGMSDRTVRDLAGLPLDRLPALVRAQLSNLTLRWPRQQLFWHLLTRATCVPGSVEFSRAQLLGVQIAAAVRLHA